MSKKQKQCCRVPGCGKTFKRTSTLCSMIYGTPYVCVSEDVFHARVQPFNVFTTLMVRILTAEVSVSVHMW